MKNFTLNLPCFLLMIVFCSCEPENTPNSPTSTKQVTTVEFGGKNLYVEKTQDGLLHQGDILIPKTEPAKIYEEGETPKATGRTSGLWEDNKVFYSIDPNLPDTERVKEAIAHWEKHSDLQFIKRSDEPDYIYFQPGSGCSSYVGKIGGKQPINLGRGCSVGSTIHEIGHALGLWHEQSRADRNNSIKIHWDNIIDGFEHNFYDYTENNLPSDEFTESLDFSSIMMYGPYFASKNGEPTITKLDGSTYSINRKGLSAGDSEGINKMYPASGEPDYVDGQYYTIYGVTVLRMNNKWYYPHFRFGYREVYEKNGNWYWK